MPAGRQLLYVSPVVPAMTGNGLAMRAGAVLCALAEHYQVSLLLVPLYASPTGALPAAIARRCRHVAVLPVTARRRATRAGLAGLLDRLRGGAHTPPVELPADSFDVVHVFRLAVLPFAGPWLAATAGRRHLDLDDVESITRRRLAALYRLNGNEALARVETAEAEHADALERKVLHEFDRVYVCSESDAEVLRGRSAAQVCVLPNSVPEPAMLSTARADAPFTFLFVGTLGYYPNEDAVGHLCTDILPCLRSAAGREFRVLVVGSGASAALQRFASTPNVQMVGAVPAIDHWYAQADAVVVPLRAGGGTRIKVLEAFSYRRPVVSTSVGVEGIAARHEEHVLLGDTAAAFAEQCVRLMRTPSLGAALAERAFGLLTRGYTSEIVARAVASCDAPPLRSGGRSDAESPAPR